MNLRLTAHADAFGNCLIVGAACTKFLRRSGRQHSTRYQPVSESVYQYMYLPHASIPRLASAVPMNSIVIHTVSVFYTASARFGSEAAVLLSTACAMLSALQNPD